METISSTNNDSELMGSDLLSDIPPLPAQPPPPPPTSYSATSQVPSFVNSPAYQDYYQQYMQYMYSAMYASQSQPMMMPNYSALPASPAIGNGSVPNFLNYNSNQQQSINTPMSNNYCNTQTNKQAAANEPQKSTIKINLKFQQQILTGKQNNSASQSSPTILNQNQPTTVMPNKVEEIAQITTSTTPVTRKSRFSTVDAISNITNEQKKIDSKQTPVTSSPAIAQPSKGENNESSKSQSDIVFDIHKWPLSLKNYCTKVYQHYQKITAVSEDQVTKYLQKRITDTFKTKPDLNIQWDQELIPEIDDIKIVAPFSQLQLQQQKKQQLQLKKAEENSKQILNNKPFPKKQVKKQFTPIKTVNKREISKDDTNGKNTKRKKRSESRSSSSSSRSSSNSSLNSSGSSSSSKNSSSSSKNSVTNFISLSDSSRTFYKKETAVEHEKNKFNNIRINSNFSGKKSFLLIENPSKKNMNKKKLFNEILEQNGNSNNQVSITQNQIKLRKKQKLMREQRFNKTIKKDTSNENFENSIVIRKQIKNIFQKEDFYEDESNVDHKQLACVGVNQDLEKEYLRLTGPPEPSMVRPLNVLKKSLEFVLNKYSKTNDYRYICDQLKAIRQDLTVQMIRNDFTIEVYETHARIALKNRDREEFNQCQSQLKNLYNLFLNSKENSETNACKNIEEFVGYRLIYNMLTKSHTDLNQVINEIKRKYSNNSYLQHLLSLRNAWHLSNYVKFFKLYKLSNDMSKCLIDLFIERERKSALKIIIKSYRPSIKLEHVCELLAYDSIQKCKEDLLAYKLVIQSVPCIEDSNQPKKNILTSKSSSNLSISSFNNSNSFELMLDCKSCSVQGF